MIIFLVHLKKLFQGQGGAMETPHDGNASKNLAHRSRGGGLKSESIRTGDYHFISMGLAMHIIKKSILTRAI